jgi:opacity protein-like surface antigen
MGFHGLAHAFSKGPLMRRLKILTLAGLVAASASTAALAADLMPSPPPSYAPVSMPLEDFGGWYLRGDAGISQYRNGKFSSPDLPPAQFYNQDFGAGSFVGIGVGYQFNSWLRADVTGEYRFSKGFKAFDRIDFDAGGGLRGTTHEITHGDYTAGVVMVNGYVDLGTWLGITPFVGAGVGFAHHMLSGFSDQSINVIGGVASPSGGSIGNASKTSFAWAIHAGLGYDVTPNFKVELAYRFMHLGDMRTGALNCFCGATYSPLRVKGLEAHEIKLGMRWLLNAPPPVAVAEAPLVRKY